MVEIKCTDSNINTYIKDFCKQFNNFINLLNTIDDYLSKHSEWYTVFNILFLILTILIIGSIFLLKSIFNFNINSLIIIIKYFNMQLEVVFSTFFVFLLSITLSKSYTSLSNHNILTENVWVKSFLFFMSKLYSLIFIVFVLGIFKGIIYIFALRENQNKPELYYPILVIIFSILIFINILLPLLLSLYGAYNDIKINECIKTIFQSLTAISLVGLIVYYICKALQIWVASSILSALKMFLNINNDFNSLCENFTNNLSSRFSFNNNISSRFSFNNKTVNDKLSAYKKFATDIINFIMVCLIFLVLLLIKSNPMPVVMKMDSNILQIIDVFANEIADQLFQSNRIANVNVIIEGRGGRRGKKK